MGFAKVKTLGKYSNDAIVELLILAGESLYWGDSRDMVASFNQAPRTMGTPNNSVKVGYRGGGWRLSPMWRIPLRGVLPAYSRVFSAVLYKRMARGSFTTAAGANIVPNGQVLTEYYGVRRPGLDYSTCEFDEYKTGGLWDKYAGSREIDVTEQPIARFYFTQSMYDQHPSTPGVPDGSNWFEPVDFKSEVQFRLDRNEDCYIIGHSRWPHTSAYDQYYELEANGTAGNNHYMEFLYVPAIVMHSSQAIAGRPIDLAGVLDALSYQTERHLFMGAIDQGETGEARKYWIRNTRDERKARRIVIEGTRAFANKPVAKATNSNAAAKELRSVDCFQLHLNNTPAIDELTPRGAWYIIATSTTQYSIYFDAGFTGTYVLKGANKNFADDVEIVDTTTTPNRKILRIRGTSKWSAGAVAINDRWDFHTVSDTTDPNFRLDSRSMMKLIPSAPGSPDVADTARARKIDSCTQRLRASTYTYNDGGTNRSVVPLGDTQYTNYAVGQKAVIFTGTAHQEVTIKQIYLTADALPGAPPAGAGAGDAVLLEELLDQNYAEGDYFTTGLYIDQLEMSSDCFVGVAGAAVGVGAIPLSKQVDWAGGDEIVAVNLSGTSIGMAQRYVVQSLSNGGAQVNISPAVTTALAAGDLVIKTVQSNARSFFVQGAVPEGSELGDRNAFVRAYEARPNLTNIL